MRFTNNRKMLEQQVYSINFIITIIKNYGRCFKTPFVTTYYLIFLKKSVGDYNITFTSTDKNINQEHLLEH